MERTVLLYNFSGKRLQNIRKSLSPLGCVIKTVPPRDFNLKIGTLLGINTDSIPAKEKTSEAFTDEMLVMYGFQGEMIDVLIAALRMGGAGKIALKAIVTEHNINWTGNELYKEIKAEHDLLN